MKGLVVTTADLAGFAVVLARTAALVATAPLLGDRTTPRIVKAVVALEREGWKVVHLWECQLKPVTMDQTLANLLKLF